MQFPKEKIDFVLTWVDDSDPVWRAVFQRYKNLCSDNHSSDGTVAERFRDWGSLRYWFRAVERYAPWVNKIYFVTCGQTPAWLNTAHPNLVLVDHKDFIPEQYLPVFSSHPIELNLHRIKGLSERFVYFNDDTFPLLPLDPQFFFKGGQPRHMAVEFPLYANSHDGFSHILLNMSELLNTHFRKSEVIRRDPQKWFSPRYGKYLLNNLCMSRFGVFSGILTPHFPSPLCKSRMARLWETLYAELDATCSHRFRSSEDINQYIFRFWDMMTGEFEPINYDSFAKFVAISDENVEEICGTILHPTVKILCVNDSKSIKDASDVKRKLLEAFRTSLPDRSSFEK